MNVQANLAVLCATLQMLSRRQTRAAQRHCDARSHRFRILYSVNLKKLNLHSGFFLLSVCCITN